MWLGRTRFLDSGFARRVLLPGRLLSYFLREHRLLPLPGLRTERYWQSGTFAESLPDSLCLFSLSIQM